MISSSSSEGFGLPGPPLNVGFGYTVVSDREDVPCSKIDVIVEADAKELASEPIKMEITRKY